MPENPATVLHYMSPEQSKELASAIVQEMIEAGAFSQDSVYWIGIWRNVIARHISGNADWHFSENES